jgi:hypothetical protein
MKHTPAPWLMNVKDKFCYEDWLYITDGKDRVICKVSHNLVELHVDEYASNASLIAAAPELLEALVKIVLQVEEYPHESWSPNSPEIILAKAAIAKVKGGKP